MIGRFPSNPTVPQEAVLQQSADADAHVSAKQAPPLPAAETIACCSAPSTVAVQLMGEAFNGLTIEPVVRSAFVGLSGYGENFGSIQELCSTARRGVYLDPKMVPVFDLPANDDDEPLNAYILDFYKHKQVY